MRKISPHKIARVITLTERGLSTAEIEKKVHISRPTIRNIRYEHFGIRPATKKLLSTIDVDTVYKYMRQGDIIEHPYRDLLKCIQIVRQLNSVFFDNITERRWVVKPNKSQGIVHIIRQL